MPDNTEGNLPPLTVVPPRLPTANGGSSARSVLATVLSLCLGLFLADAFVSLADDSLMVFFNLHLLAGLRLAVGLFGMLLALVVYVLMAVTPMIPKRLFLPVTLFNPAAVLLFLPFMIYCYGELPWVAWSFSMVQVVLGLAILFWLQGGLKMRWPLVPVARLGTRGFSWLNLGGFVLANLLVLLPATVIFLMVCTASAVSHFSDGFMALHPGGFTVQARKYVRNDGKTVELYPMSHIADAAFYREISSAFPSNSIILLEGVTDKNNLLANPISYQRVASSLGLTEQHVEFVPKRGRKVRADVDISVFSTNTLALLNLVMLVHANGLTPALMQSLALHPQSPQSQAELFDDLLNKRNAHLVGELNTRLAQTDHIIVPWGAAHMPGISREIIKEGFQVAETRDYWVIRFGGGGDQVRSAGQ